MKCPFCIKVCGKCGRLLVANNDNFSKNKTGKYGYHSKCKECVKTHVKKYNEEHKEEIKIRDKKKYEKNKNNPEFKEKKRKYNEEHKNENSEYQKQYYEEHKDEILEYKKQWRKNNPDKIFNQNNKRRSNENQGNGITKEQWLEMMNFFEWKCAYSDEYIGGDKNKEIRSIDHVIALDNGGENEIWNCVPMKLEYNKSKYINNMLEWYQEQIFYSEERLNKIYQWIEYSKNKYQE